MNEITHPQLIKQIKQLEKQITQLQQNLAVWPRTKMDGGYGTRDGKVAQECIDNIKYQIGMIKMIVG